MKITALKEKRKGLTQVFIDGEYAMTLDSMVLLENHVKENLEISDEELYKIVKKSKERRANEKALTLLEYRSHSKKELTDKIARTMGREEAMNAAEKMADIGLVNDRDYAERYAKELFERKKFGKNRVKQELKLKGIDGEIIEEVLALYEDFDTKEQIESILNSKYPNYLTDEKVKRRAVAALQRRGFTFSDIRAFMKDLEF
ncbi:MAG: regulatory protein RecX [Ruminococcaceae bacterium]|nr:regulatory protein RecX [Oscillospiraceae bacterium]